MEKKKFLYFLTDENGKCFKLDHRGKVISDNQIKALPQTPDGWQDKMIEYSRNKTYRGMVRAFTVPMRFVTDGADIIRYLFYTYGVEAICFLRIAKLNVSTGIHEPYYVGSLDFSTFDDDKTGQYAEVAVLDSGLAATIKNKEGTTTEIPMGPDMEDPVPVSDDPTINVLIDGVKLLGKYYFVTDDTLTFITEGQLLDAIFVTSKGVTASLLCQNVTHQEVGVPGDIPGLTNKWLAKTIRATTLTITLDYAIQIAESYKNEECNYNVRIGTDADITGKSLTGDILVDSKTAKVFSGTATVTLDLAEGAFLYLYSTVTKVGGGGSLLDVKYNTFDLHIDSLPETTSYQIKALRPSFVFERLVHKLSSLANNTISDMLAQNDLETGHYSVVLTTGDAIRGLKDVKMKTTFQDFFKAMNIIFNAGMGVQNEKAVLEHLDYFYDETDEVDLGEVSNLKLTPDTDAMCNLIQVGYQPQTYDDVNGKDEFNNTSEFSTPLTRIKRTLDLVSPYRADMYGITFTAVNYTADDSTDSSSDDTIFLLVVNSKPFTDADGNTYHNLYRAPGATVTGLVSPETAFNIEIAPKHLLRRHGNYIHAGLDKQDAKSLKFQSADKNDGMAITYPADPLLIGSHAVTITEKADQPISELADKLYLPYIFEFDTMIPSGAKKIMDANPRGLVSFTWKGIRYKGFINDCSIKPAFNEEQTWKILSAASNDLTGLING